MQNTRARGIAAGRRRLGHELFGLLTHEEDTSLTVAECEDTRSITRSPGRSTSSALETLRTGRAMNTDRCRSARFPQGSLTPVRAKVAPFARTVSKGPRPLS